MQFNLEETVLQIKNNKNFQNLKNTIENNSYHDHESVYDHLVKTHRIASEEIEGKFITNPQAKENFNRYIDEEIDGVKKRDLMQISALIHDVGKSVIKVQINPE